MFPFFFCYTATNDADIDITSFQICCTDTVQVTGDQRVLLNMYRSSTERRSRRSAQFDLVAAAMTTNASNDGTASRPSQGRIF
jgi:hypothetical protein